MSVRSTLCKWLGCHKEPVVNNIFGWKRDLPDHRDVRFATVDDIAEDSLPKFVDLRQSGFMPAVYDQGRLGSCTANSIAAAIEYDRAKQGLPVWTPSRLWIYYYERLMEGTVNSDSGAMIRDGFKVINSNGFVKETTWPYDISNFKKQPNQAAQDEAKLYKVVKYQSVDQTKHAIRAVLANGYPICFGISVFSNIQTDEVATTGVVQLPGNFDRSLGGHAILIVGYDDAKERYIFRNSWGSKWGDHGYGYLPYLYVHGKLASDFWVVETINE